MKNRPFNQRLGFAFKGITSTWKSEASFRTQVIAGMGAFVILITLRPAPVWWAIFILTISGVLSAELFNTALEKVIDRLHPEQDPLIALAKDCAAGAVLVFSFASLVIAALLIIGKIYE